MTARQSRALAMYDMVLVFFGKYPGHCKQAVALEEAIARFRNYHQSIREARSLHLSSREHGATAKNVLKKQLCAGMMTIVSAMKVFALRTNNAELAKKVSITHHSLSRTRDHLLAPQCIALVKLAEANEDKLKVYAVSPGQISSLRSLCDRYRSHLGSRLEELNDRPQITKEMSKLFTEASALLRKEIDPLMEVLLQEKPRLLDEYHDARKLRKLPGRKKKRAKKDASLGKKMEE